MGYPLLAGNGNVLGNLAVLDTEPMPPSFRDLALFRIFAARATAELLRLRAEEEIRAREERFAGLFNGAMDAIVELDHDLRIGMMNPAAEKMFGCAGSRCLGLSISGFLTPEDFSRLRRIARQLEKRSGSARNAWGTEGLVVLSAEKKKISAEATVSLVEFQDDATCVLILRDVNERYEARKIIESLRDETEYLMDSAKVVNGVNVDELFGTIDAVKQAPVIAAFKFRASSEWIDGGHNRTTINHFYGTRQEHSRNAPFRLDADEPPVLLGNDLGPNPVEYALTALAACVTTSIVYHAAARGGTIRSMSSRLEGDIDLQGFLGLKDDVPRGYKEIRMYVTIDADAPPEKLEEIVQLGPTYSPVFDTFTRPVPVRVRLER